MRKTRGATALAAGAPEDVAWDGAEVARGTQARARPLTLVFEDIHWAEPPLLDLIEHVAEWSRDAPMLLFCLARPDLRDHRAAWGGEAITLEPLTVEESDELIESLHRRHGRLTRAHDRASATSLKAIRCSSSSCWR